MLWHLHMYPPTNTQIGSYISPGHPTAILPSLAYHTLTQPSTHPPSLESKPSHTASFTFSYSTSSHRRVRMSSETYHAGPMSSCASSAPARGPEPRHHQPRNCSLVHSHKQSGVRGANRVYHYRSGGGGCRCHTQFIII